MWSCTGYNYTVGTVQLSHYPQRCATGRLKFCEALHFRSGSPLWCRALPPMAIGPELSCPSKEDKSSFGSGEQTDAISPRSKTIKLQNNTWCAHQQFIQTWEAASSFTQQVNLLFTNFLGLFLGIFWLWRLHENSTFSSTCKDVRKDALHYGLSSVEQR